MSVSARSLCAMALTACATAPCTDGQGVSVTTSGLAGNQGTTAARQSTDEYYVTTINIDCEVFLGPVIAPDVPRAEPTCAGYCNQLTEICRTDYGTYITCAPKCEIYGDGGAESCGDFYEACPCCTSAGGCGPIEGGYCKNSHPQTTAALATVAQPDPPTGPVPPSVPATPTTVPVAVSVPVEVSAIPTKKATTAAKVPTTSGLGGNDGTTEDAVSTEQYYLTTNQIDCDAFLGPVPLGGGPRAEPSCAGYCNDLTDICQTDYGVFITCAPKCEIYGDGGAESCGDFYEVCPCCTSAGGCGPLVDGMCVDDQPATTAASGPSVTTDNGNVLSVPPTMVSVPPTAGIPTTTTKFSATTTKFSATTTKFRATTTKLSSSSSSSQVSATTTRAALTTRAPDPANTVEPLNLIEKPSAFSVISSGYNHLITATSNYSTISGGVGNTVINSNEATITGGFRNIVYSRGGAISGGYYNYVSGRYGTVLGGSKNSVMARHATAMGFQAIARGQLSLVMGFGGNLDEDETDQSSFCQNSPVDDRSIKVCADRIMLNDVDVLQVAATTRRLEETHAGIAGAVQKLTHLQNRLAERRVEVQRQLAGQSARLASQHDLLLAL